MARVRDLWHNTKGNVTAKHPLRKCRQAGGCPGGDPGLWRTGKEPLGRQFLAAWIDGDGNERTRAFDTKKEAEKFGVVAQVDSSRGM